MKVEEFEKAVEDALATKAKERGLAEFQSPKDVFQDSLGVVEFIILLEDRLGFEIDDSEILDLNTSSTKALATDLLVLFERTRSL